MRKMPDILEPGGIFGRRVREERTRQGLTLEQLAARIEKVAEPGKQVDASTIARVERGDTKGRLDTVMLYAVALGAAPIDLILPWDDDQFVRIPGHDALPAREAREWIRGERLLDDQSPVTWFAALSEAHQDALVRRGLVATAGSELDAALAGWTEPQFIKGYRLRLANRADKALRHRSKEEGDG
jgi:transcriptional regulator with XRE-family HTH domain